MMSVCAVIVPNCCRYYSQNRPKSLMNVYDSQIEFYGDFDASFHKSLDLTIDLSVALLGTRSHRYDASALF